jgi:hypothetical protein
MASDDIMDDPEFDELSNGWDELDTADADETVIDADAVLEDTEGFVSLEEEPKKKKKKLVPFLVGLLSVGLIGGGITLGVMSMGGGSTLTDMDGRIVAPDEPDSTTKEFLEEAQMIVDEGGLGFEIPVAGLNVPLGSINPVKGVMNPPNFTSAFWIREVGVSPANAEKGTVVIVTHSLRAPGKAPGNFYQKDGNTFLSPGDFIKVNGRVYAFTESMIIPKVDIGAKADIWEKTPGKLVVITCLQPKGGGATVNNLVLIGELVP